MVTSTASDTGRIPHSSSRRAIHTGVAGRGVEPATRCAATSRSAAVGSSTTPGWPAPSIGQRLEVGRVVERDAVRRGRLAGDAAHRQRVRPVRRDGDVEHLVAQAEQLDRVGAERSVADQVRGEHQDAVVVVAGAQLAAGADHAVADVAVGLARGDREAAGQRRPGQRDHDEVADGEVQRTADDAARLRLAHVDLAPADGLAVGGGLLLERRAPGPARPDR